MSVSDEAIRAAVLEAHRDQAPEDENDRYWFDSRFGYTGLIELGVDEVLGSWDFGTYQGDSYVIGRQGEQFGWLNYGWGSCSGCDALQGCRSAEELADLAVSLHNSWHWEDSLQALYTYLSNKDWEAEYSYYMEDSSKARVEMLATLENYHL